MADEKANANPPTGSWSAAVAAGYLGIAVDLTPNLNYTVAGGVQPLPTPESQYKQIKVGQYAVLRASVSGDTAPAPTLTSIAPNTYSLATLPKVDTPVVLTGTNFDLRSVVMFFGSALATTFVSATPLNVTLPTTNATQAGNWPLTVYTSPPGGGTSAAVNFTITA